MKPLKFKIRNGRTNGYEGMAFRIQAVYFNSQDPSSRVMLMDKENDPVCHPIPGQLEPKLTPVEQISCVLPLHTDYEGVEEITVYGEVYYPSLDNPFNRQVQ
jgi:hypothetical protein